MGFGAQNLVKDVISGFFMILENQVRVGDVAIVNGTGGLVEQINFRTIVLRDLSGVVHIFPNGSVNTLANMTREWSAYVLDIGVAYKENVDRVMDVMRAVGAELRADEKYGALMIEDIEISGVDKFDDSAVVIRARLKTLPIKQWRSGASTGGGSSMPSTARASRFPSPSLDLFRRGEQTVPRGARDPAARRQRVSHASAARSLSGSMG